MNEFKVHHLVSQLLTHLRVQDSHSPEVYAELLTKNLTPYVTTQVSTHHAKRKIAEFSPNGEEFLKKYDELKPKQTRVLDPLVYLLACVSEDKALCDFLQECASSPQATTATDAAVTEVETIKLPGDTQELTLPPSGTIMTQKELDKLRGDLANLTQALSGKDITRKDKGVLKGLPKLPTWVTEQRYLSSDFVTPAKAPNQPVVRSLPVHSQELAIIDDLLFLMIGINGRYITAKPLNGKLAMRTFAVDHTLDLSMHALVNRILPLCSYYSTISRFLEEYSRFEYGIVNQALCASMRGVMKEYLILVAQLEHQHNMQQLSLQKLWYYIQPSLKSLEILSSIATTIQSASCKGGPVLSLLHDKAQSLTGDDKAQELCLHLTQAAAVPYFDILEQWIYKGIVHDPYQEFMVEDHKTVEKEQLSKEYNDSYWESRYTIASEKIPSFLEHVAMKILNSGKYLNVIHECGVEISYPGATELIYSLHDKQYVELIEEAFVFASKKLLDLLINEHNLLGRLTSIKHYFLLEQGDYLVHFMDMAFDELKKKTSDIQITRLESLLELALRTSVAVSDPFKDDLQAMLSSFDLTTQLFHIMSIQPDIDTSSRKRSSASFPLPDPSTINLSGLEAFSLDYNVGWPLSLIINRKALTKYQLLFRHLFYCKHIERQLCAAWLSRKADNQTDKSSWHTSAFILQQQMLVFVQSFQYYMMFEVIEPNWTILYQSLQRVSTVDDVLACHTDFLDACLKDCMLTNSDVLRTITELMVVCATYSGCMKRYSSQETRASASTRQDEKSDVVTHVLHRRTSQLIASDDVEQTINNFDHEFTKHVLALLEKLTHISTSESEHSMLNLVARLDYNGFFTGRPETKS